MSEPTVPPPPSYTPPPPPPPPPSAGGPGYVSPNRTIMIVLAYLGILAVIPLVVEKEDKEVQWHAKHGLVLLAAEIVLFILIFILGTMTAFMHIGCGGCILQWVASVAIFVLHIMAIVKGVNGQRLIIPGLSEFADRF
jgi:uncharacterized membrane protein